MNVLITLLFLISYSADTFSASIIYGFSSVTLPNEIQEFVYRGFLLSLNSYKGVDPKKDLKLIHSGGNSLTSPIETAREVLKENPQIITGFPSSLESQLAAPTLRDSKILTVFASSSNTNLGNMGENIYSTSEDVSKTSELIASKVLRAHPKAMGAIIYNPFDYFSVNQKKIWEEIKRKNSGLNFHMISTNPDGNLSDAQINACRKLTFVIVTMFPNKAYNIFKELYEHDVDPTIYTNSSWYKIDYNILMRFILTKKKPVYVVKLDNFDKKIAQKVIKKYQSIYNANPPFEVFIGYDLGIVIGKVLSESKKQHLTPLQVIKSMPCFTGSPLGKICFKSSGGFVPRDMTLVKIK